MEILLLLAGLLLLVGGAQVLVTYAVKLARWFGVSDFVIGLTVVTIGTNLPETMVSVIGAVSQLGGQVVSSLVVGEIIGSNLTLLGVVVALAALIHPIKIKHHELVQHGAFAVASVLLLWVLAKDGLLSRPDGVALMMVYALYALFISRGRHRRSLTKLKEKPNIVIALGLIFGSSFALIIGARWVLEFGTQLALAFGVSPTLVGLFIIGPSTSLPELVVNLTAAFRKRAELSLGNILGTIVYSISIALGVGVTIAEFTVASEIVSIDLPFLMLLSFLVLLFFYSREVLQRKEGLLLLGLYVTYVAMKFLLLA